LKKEVTTKTNKTLQKSKTRKSKFERKNPNLKKSKKPLLLPVALIGKKSKRKKS